jgi:hypothetical protein
MHNGYFKSLHDVVDFYNTRDLLPKCLPSLGTAIGGEVGYTCWPAPEVSTNVNHTRTGNLGSRLITTERVRQQSTACPLWRAAEPKQPEAADTPMASRLRRAQVRPDAGVFSHSTRKVLITSMISNRPTAVYVINEKQLN